MLVTVMVAVVMTATMTAGHDDDSEDLFSGHASAANKIIVGRRGAAH